MAELERGKLRAVVNKNRALITPYINPDYLLAELWSLDKDLMWGIRRIWMERQLFSATVSEPDRTQFRGDLVKLQRIIEESQQILRGTSEPLTYLAVYDQGLLPLDIIEELLNLGLQQASAEVLEKLKNSLRPIDFQTTPEGLTLALVKKSLEFYIALRKKGERT